MTMRKQSPLSVLTLSWLVAIFWTLLILASAFWNNVKDKEDMINTATAEAQANHAKDLSFRRWATGHGGVYVPVTPTQPPVPWLAHLPDSVVTTTDGRQLALLNPASMLRQVMDRFAADYGVKGRITGLKYLNPGNAPDDWERRKMEDFQKGLYQEVTELVTIDGKPYMRYLKAMYMENAGCIRCHAVLGFTKVGEFRGAIGVNVPMERYIEEYEKHRTVLITSHGGIWLAGLLGIAAATRQRRRVDRERDQAMANLAESEARFRSLVDTSPSAMLVTSLPPQSKVLLMNQRFTALFGYTEQDIPDVTAWWPRAYPDPQYRKDVQQIWDQALADMTAAGAQHIAPVSVEVRCKDGAKKYVEVHMTAQGDRGLVVFNDLTARRLAEQQLHELNITLEQRVHQRTAELESANHDLEAFSYSVSHDLRAPLRAINGFSQILVSEESAHLSADAKDMLDRIAKAANKLGDLIDDVLEYSRVGRAAKAAETIDMRALAGDVSRELGEGYPECEFRIGALPVVDADPTMLRQILENLIGNACKYSATRRPARVEIDVAETPDHCTFFVRDNGVGFDMQYADKLFGMFQRLHNDRDFDGTGVGLAIVKRLVERHGGRVWAEAAVDRGATFYFTLGPDHKPAAEQRQ